MYSIKSEFNEIFSCIDELFKKGGKSSETKVNLENIAKSDEERKMIKSGDEYIEDVCNKRKELIESDIEPFRWLDEKIDQAVKTLIPDVTEANYKEIKSDIEETEMQRIGMLIDLSKKDLNGLIIKEKTYDSK